MTRRTPDNGKRMRHTPGSRRLLRLLTPVPLAVAMLLAACSNDDGKVERDFVPSGDVKAVIGDNLYGWVDQAPFKAQWKPYADAGSDDLVLTNTSAIFPYMGTFYTRDGTEVGSISEDNSKLPHLYGRDQAYFKDPDWGPVQVYAALMYDPYPVWVDDFHMINQALDPANLGNAARSTPESMRLIQTGVTGRHPDYHTAIYQAPNPVAGDFLFGFYQQGQLIFEVSLRCGRHDAAECLDKLDSTAQTLGLDIPEWQNADAADLQANGEDTFWDAQFETVFAPGARTGGMRVQAHMPGADYALADRGDDADRRVIRRHGGDADVSLELAIEDTGLDSDAFAEQAEGERRNHYPNDLYIEDAQRQDDGTMRSRARSYLANGKVLVLTGHYPEGNQQAKRDLRALMHSIRTREPV